MSYLPLVFADGQPTSVEKMTQPQLERFIPFMVECCPKRDNNRPVWWPKQLPFSFPLKPTSNLVEDWVPFLKDLVVRCYKYYNSVYILTFCRKLAQLGTERLILKENADRVDIIETTSKKLLVSVKAKNKTYDQATASPHKSLLPRPLASQSSYKSQPIDDIYLCTYCDAEFTCCKDACDHENEAHSESVAEEQSTPQERVLKSIGLLPIGRASAVNDVTHRQRRIASNLSLKKCLSIPLCTPLGSLLLAKTPNNCADIAESLAKVEEFCCTRDMAHCTREQSVGVTRRSRRTPGATPLPLRLRQHVWVHEYCFNKKHKAERIKCIQTGLNARARRLLRQCRDVRVKIRRLPPVPGNTTIDLKMLKKFIAEEYPGQDVLTKFPDVEAIAAAAAAAAAATAASSNQPSDEALSDQLLNELLGVRIPSAKRVLTNKVPPNQILENPLAAKWTPRSTAVKPPPSEPILIDLCSSDEECEIISVPQTQTQRVVAVSPADGRVVARPGLTVTYPSHVHLPKYGATAASREATTPKTVAEVGLAASQPTVLFGRHFCQTRS